MIRIVEVMPGKQKPRPAAYAHRYVRLYNRNHARFSSSPVHDLVQLRAGTRPKRLKGIIHHHSIRGVGEQVTKFNRYTDALVRDLGVRKAMLPTWGVFVEFPIAFLKAFILRRHFLNGTYGFLTAMNYAFFRHLRIAKHYESRRIGPSSGSRPDGESR